MRYQHYKGGVYKLLSTSVLHTETYERLAVYENEKGEVFARPYDMFFENVVVDGKKVPRFKEIKESKAPIGMREYPVIAGKDAEIFFGRQKNYMDNLLKKYGRNKA
jgi:hypothetical protein